jgi:hypothetical protein
LSCRALQFRGLDEDWPILDQRVAAEVVKVQVAVGHVRHLFQTHGDGVQRSPEILLFGPVVSIDIRGRSHPGVKEKHPIRMYDNVSKTSLESWRARAGLFTRANEVSEVKASNLNICHPASVAE